MCAQGPNFISLSRMKETTVQENSDRAESEEEQLRKYIETILMDSRQYQRIVLTLKRQLQLIDTDTDITEFYPEFVFENDYQTDQEKNIIEDSELAMLIDKLEFENRSLKAELKAWTHQFGKKARLSEVLIQQNKLIKQQLCQKDKGLVTLIQTLGNGYGQSMQLREHRLHQLTEQNNLLLEHLSRTQSSLASKKSQQKSLGQLIDEANNQRNTLRQKLAKLMEDEEHYSKLFALTSAGVQGLAKKLQRTKLEEQRLENINGTLKKEQTELKDYMDEQSGEVSDIRRNLEKENEDKGKEERQLRTELADLQLQISAAAEKERQLELAIEKGQANLLELESISKASTEKVKEAEAEAKALREKLDKQLEKQAEKGNELSMANYSISVIEARLSVLSENRKRQAEQQPNKIKQIIEDRQSERKSIEKRISELQSKHSIALLTLNSDVNKERTELQKLQGQLNSRRQDMRELRRQIQEARMNKQNIRTLAATLKSKKAQISSLKSSVMR